MLLKIKWVCSKEEGGDPTWPCACQETKWALYSQTVAGLQLASGNQCEACWTLWQQGFRHESWDGLLNKVARDPAFKAQVEEAMLQGRPKDVPDQSVLTVQGTSVEVERSYIIMSERDLRRASGLSRIGRTQLKGLQSVQLPLEDGQQGQETCYLFKDDANPQRRMKIKVHMATQMESEVMKPGEVLWPDQPGCYQAHYTQQKAKESGVWDVINKEQAGHLNITNFETFARDILKVEVDSEQHDTGAAATAQPAQDGVFPTCGLVGVAAAKPSGPMASLTSPPSAAKKVAGQTSSILRTPSSMSLGSAPEEPAASALVLDVEEGMPSSSDKPVPDSASAAGESELPGGHFQNYSEWGAWSQSPLL